MSAWPGIIHPCSRSFQTTRPAARISSNTGNGSWTTAGSKKFTSRRGLFTGRPSSGRGGANLDQAALGAACEERVSVVDAAQAVLRREAQQRLQRDPRLDARERCADADVGADPEPEVLLIRTANVEPPGLRPARGVAVARGQQHE